MTTRDIRQGYLEFFRARGHTILPSASIVPEGDPTLLFTNAGMVPFKPYYLEGADPPSRRVATVQKCLRAGGKDSDLERVGATGRHHSFFEMLGNFSFGDYFKDEAIAWAWEFVMEHLRFPREKIWVSIYRDDDEAHAIWERKIGLPAERIVRLGEKDNFWGPAGASGVCGPCSELYLDRGPEHGCGAASCAPGCDCERYMEFWNLVFPQFYQNEDGTRRRLATPGIDTGMGLERVASLAQGVKDNFEIDVFRPITSFVRERIGAGAADGGDGPRTVRLVADHARTLSFAVADGVLPGNEGRGYVLRRILRRAVLAAHKLGVEEPFFFEVAGVVVDTMGADYPELASHREQIGLALRGEEERFFRVLQQSGPIFDELLAAARARGDRRVRGEELFRLYDTYGIPADVTKSMAVEEGLEVDEEGFERELEAQRERARAASGFQRGAAQIEAAQKAEKTPFLGYDALEAEAKVTAAREAEERGGREGGRREIEVVLDRTPFYAESGGQVGDTGVLRGPGWTMEVRETFREAGGATVHRGVVREGAPKPGDAVRAEVDAARRAAIRRNHTATHLLQAALREVLGTHVRQQGSLVAPDRLRFDFSHFAPLTEAERARIEETVNRDLLANLPVATRVTSYRQAKEEGALAFFGEKYGDEVRVVSVAGRSAELCGGTHVGATGEIGLLTLVHESGVAAGVRRIEAFTGEGARRHLQEQARLLGEAAELLRAPWNSVPEKLQKLLDEQRQREREMEKLRGAAARDQVATLVAEARAAGDAKVVAARIEGEADKDALRALADELRGALGRGVVVLAGVREGKVLLVAAVTPDLVKEGRLHAGRIVGEVARMVGGGGGGRPDFAEAGGKDPEKIAEALARVPGVAAAALSAG